MTVNEEARQNTLTDPNATITDSTTGTGEVVDFPDHSYDTSAAQDQIVREAVESASAQFGVNPQGRPEPVTDDDPERRASAAEIVNRWMTNGSTIESRELDKKEFPPTQWIVPGLISEGCGLFTGSPKVGKSWAMLDLVLAAASGGKAFGAIDVQQRPVLYLALEDGQRRLQERSRTLIGPGQPLPSGITFCTEQGPEAVAELVPAWLKLNDSKNPLVIIDTLGMVMPPKAAGESEYQRDYRAIGRYKDLAKAHPGSCILIVHHVRKMTTGDWMESTSGTNGLNGAADFTINLSAGRGADEGVLSVTGRDVTGGTYAVHRSESSGGTWRLAGDGLMAAAQQAEAVHAKQGLGDISVRIIDVLASRDGPTSLGEITKALGDVPRNTVDQTLRRLVDAERVVRVSRGVYALRDTEGQPPTLSVRSVRFPEESAGSCGSENLTAADGRVRLSETTPAESEATPTQSDTSDSAPIASDTHTATGDPRDSNENPAESDNLTLLTALQEEGESETGPTAKVDGGDLLQAERSAS